MLVDALTGRVGGRSLNLWRCCGGRRESPPGGGAVESQMSLSLRAFWGTLARREMQRRVEKVRWAAADVRITLKPRDTRSRSSARQKEEAAAVRVEMWGPWAMAAAMVCVVHAGPTWTGMPSVAKEARRGVAGCLASLGGAAIVRDWQEPKKKSREGAAEIAAAVTEAQWAMGSVPPGTEA